MEFEIYNVKKAKQILQSNEFDNVYNEITDVLKQLPLFIYPNKSKRNSNPDVVQQLMNVYLDYKFSVEYGWEYQPSIDIESTYRADFRKHIQGIDEDLKINMEVQFGNMARFPTDLLKFTSSNNANAMDVGVSIVPVSKLSKRIGQNIAYFNGCINRIKSTQNSMMYPLLLIGIKEGRKTQVVDISKTDFKSFKEVTSHVNKFRIINGVINNIPLNEINIKSDVGKIPTMVKK